MTQNTENTPTPAKQPYELSRRVDIDDVRNRKKVTVTIKATPQECAALAKRMSILEMTDLNAQVTVSVGARKDLFQITGNMVSNLVQECCVTLAPVIEKIEDSFSEQMTSNPDYLATKSDDEDHPVFNSTDERPVELITDNIIDAGEVVAQWLTLALNPYPRSDAPFFSHIESSETEVEKGVHTPFKVLESLK